MNRERGKPFLRPLKGLQELRGNPIDENNKGSIREARKYTIDPLGRETNFKQNFLKKVPSTLTVAFRLIKLENIPSSFLILEE